MGAPFDPVPVYDPIADPKSGRLSPIWFRWLSALATRLLAAITVAGNAVHRPSLSSALSPTALYEPSRDGERVRVSWAALITTAATVSSALAVGVSWTSGGLPCSKTFPALTANTAGTADGSSVFLRPDAGTAVSYSTTYATSGATPMVYTLDVVAESVV